MLFLAVGSSRFSSSVLRQFSSKAVKLLVDLLEHCHSAGPQVLFLGPEVAVGTDRRGVQVILDQREARLELGQPGLKFGQAGMRQQRYAGQLLQALQPWVFEQFLLLARPR